MIIVLKVSNNSQMLLKSWSLRGSSLAAPAWPHREIYGRPQLKVFNNFSIYFINIAIWFIVSDILTWFQNVIVNGFIHCHILECYLKIWLHPKYTDAGKSQNPSVRLLTLLTHRTIHTFFIHRTIHSCNVTIQCQLLDLLRRWSAVQDRTKADAEDPILSADKWGCSCHLI